MPAFLIMLVIFSALILVGMRVSLNLYASGALRVKPLRLLRLLKPLVPPWTFNVHMMREM
jgi:hypothetical protein